MAHSTAYFDVEERPASVPIWREALFGFDWLTLRASPVLYGCGIPRGDGAPVVVVPGFLGSDVYLLEMYFWLGRIGYRPFLSRIGRNAECLDLLLGRLLGTVEEARASTGRPVHLIGHSLGGMLARSAAVRRPDRIASVITLGSPFRGIRSHPLVMQATSAVRARIRNRAEQRDDRPDCFTAACRCDTVAALQAPLPPSFPRSRSTPRRTASWTGGRASMTMPRLTSRCRAPTWDWRGTRRCTGSSRSASPRSPPRPGRARRGSPTASSAAAAQSRCSVNPSTS